MWNGTAEILKACRPARNEAEDEAERTGFRRQGLGDFGKAGVAGEAIDQRHAVEQQTGGERAEHEILQRPASVERRLSRLMAATT